ncbi:UDP-glucose 4-epimerase GalE [Bradyrhizobium sp.]|uniref:UDP-glucose 4-epimerase GalE n=1 Tax=Bradyrhizobium sp. TaxID=376 RepID=UPI0023982E93|nr:UDP-glucose 4-epimerase GalE [Bradyrhizobium sp.]MDE1934395.1 UDP-glucose 4-epimerase GalE [Bradyrhizobium sp.]
MILVTGGAGYIGSHTCVELLNAGKEIVVLDNFANSSRKSLERVRQISRKPFAVVEGDIRDQAVLEKTLKDFGCAAVIHFAGLKSVLESVNSPLDYYDNNVIGSHRLLRAMQTSGVKRMIFSSSATVYGDPKFLPYTEDHPLNPVNPYGRTKLIVEEMLRDLSASDPTWSIGILRYFNPIGAHESGLIGEDPKGVPNNLLPFVAQVAVGRRERLNIWGNDYDTADGTGVRDYIHVVDLAQGHVAALKSLEQTGCFALNLGTGRGNSVLEVVKAFEQASGKPIPYDMRPRRSGDIASCYAATDRATRYLGGWRATRDIETMCRDHWRWQSQNPNGYAG